MWTALTVESRKMNDPLRNWVRTGQNAWERRIYATPHCPSRRNFVRIHTTHEYKTGFYLF